MNCSVGLVHCPTFYRQEASKARVAEGGDSRVEREDARCPLPRGATAVCSTFAHWASEHMLDASVKLVPLF